VVIKTDRSDNTEIKKFFLKISGYQRRWPGPFPGLPSYRQLVVADLFLANIPSSGSAIGA
jgi:hypothetical protein